LKVSWSRPGLRNSHASVPGRLAPQKVKSFVHSSTGNPKQPSKKKGEGRMFAIVYKEDRVPMCARLRENGPDAIVTWDSDAKAKAFLESKGGEFVSAYDVVAISDDSLKDMAGVLGIKEEEIELIPFPS
jgi:hypothetical protein